jgi:DNA-binding CsgD family transcriptional regulator
MTAMRADRVPMWPAGLVTRKCLSCRSTTDLPTCPTCGGETTEAVVFNTAKGNPRGRWGLTDREAQVMVYVAAGCSNQEVADRLGMAEKTAKELLLRARTKMGATNRVHAARMWWEAAA